jgi:hypothetical protein
MQTRIITGLCAAIALSSSLLGCASSGPAPTAADPKYVAEIAQGCSYAQPIASAAALGGSLVPIPGAGAAVAVVAQGVAVGCSAEGQARLAMDATSAAWLYKQASDILKSTKKAR